MEEKSFALIAIVAIVAIVGMVVLIIGGQGATKTNPSTIILPSGEQGNVAGEAIGSHQRQISGISALDDNNNNKSVFDYNNDNAVNDKDVSFILRVSVGTSSCPAGKDCDLDNDGGVSAYDASLLKQLIEKTTFDYNNDSTVNNKDVDYLLGIVVGTNTCPTGKTCDINNDKRITSYDASLLMQMTSELH